MSPPFPPARAAGPFVVTGGFDGRDPAGAPGSIRDQCDRAYGLLAAALAQHALTADAVVRLDHFTQSQGWLAERQAARAALFGRPAPLASTGVASAQIPGNLLTVAGIASAQGPAEVLVPGNRYGMGAIATAVRAGEWLFVSGLLTRSADDATAQLLAILGLAGLGPDALVRLDSYVADHRQAAAVAAALPLDGVARTTAVLPFAQPDQLEITALATASPIRRHHAHGALVVEAGGVAVTGMIEAADPGGIEAEVDDVVDRLAALLATTGRDLGQVARLELCLADPGDAAPVAARLAHRLPEPRPALLLWSGGPPGSRLRLSAIAG